MKSRQAAAVVSTSVLAAGAAHGAILYSGPVDQMVAVNSSYNFDLNQDGAADFGVFFDGLNGGNTSKPCIRNISGTPMPFVLSQSNTGEPVIPFGTMIDGDFNIGTNEVSVNTNSPSNGYLYEQYNNDTVVGEWPPNGDTVGYVGLEIVSSGGTNFGWVELEYNGTNNNNITLTVLGYAYETTAGTGIIAGSTNEVGAPNIYAEPISQTVPVGTTTEMSVEALANPAPSYQWMAGAVGSGVYTNLSDVGNISGSATSNLVISGVSPANDLDYVVVVSNSLGSATSSPPATLTVVPAIVSGPVPAEQILFAGSTAHFTIGANSGAPLAIQWQKNGVNLSDGGRISGSTNNTLQISNVVASDDGTYDAIVTASSESVTSSAAPLTVIQPDGTTYEEAILAAQPVDYYRLSETNNPGNGGVIAYDNTGGINGVYGQDVENGFDGIFGPTPSAGFTGFETTNYAAESISGDPTSTIALSPWNLNTNTVTFTAWVNPQGPQVANAGVVFTRGTNSMVCGIFYGGTSTANGDHNLGFDWNDQIGAWNWNSGLSVPEGQWSMLALVISQTNETLYVLNSDGMSNAVDGPVDGATNAVQSFNTTEYIGTDPAGANGARNFNGMIGDVAIFNYALSGTQVQNLYNAALNIAPPTTLNITRVGSQLQLTWGNNGQLLQSTNLLGPWTTNSTATSGYLVTPTAAQMFYKILAP